MLHKDFVNRDFADVEKTYYVYGLVDPRDGAIFYVGKGKRATNGRIERYLAHEHATRKGDIMCNYRKYRRIKDIWEAGHRVHYEFYHESDDAADIDFWERRYIELVRVGWSKDIANITDGGTGGVTWTGEHPMKGKKFSAESRAKMSAARKGRPSPRKGVKLSDETKAKLRAAHKRQVEKNGPIRPFIVLPEDKAKQIYKLRDKDGMPVKTIARLLNVGPTVVKRYLTQERPTGQLHLIP